MTLRVKGWDKFQHFKDRRPPWIKLYRDLLDDIEWHELEPAASKALVMLWLIASESADGRLPANKELAFRLRTTEKQIETIVSKLGHWLYRDDDKALSGRTLTSNVSDHQETETETYKKEKEQTLSGKPDAVSILEFLNKKTGKNFQPLPANLELIKARLEEASADDIRSVIAVKCRQWSADEKMSIYLRPETLFGRTKFAQYLGELLPQPETPQ